MLHTSFQGVQSYSIRPTCACQKGVFWRPLRPCIVPASRILDAAIDAAVTHLKNPRRAIQLISSMKAKLFSRCVVPRPVQPRVGGYTPTPHRWRKWGRIYWADQSKLFSPEVALMHCLADLHGEELWIHQAAAVGTIVAVNQLGLRFS